MKRILIILGLLIASGTRPAHAQTPGQPAGAPPAAMAANGEIRGVVMDTAAKAPIPRPQITVRSTRDSSVVAGAIGNADGTFRIQGLRPGVYRVRATSIGYGPRTQEVTIGPAAAAPTAISFELSRVAVALQGVEVTGERASVTIEPDRNSYRAKDVAPAAANAGDVLEATPSVQVDGEGKISLRGNENVAIQINGRPSPIRGAQLTQYLKQIPANIVDKIEIIPNPSAKYDPEGMAGIINIQLKANTDLGVSGGVTTSAAQTGRYNASGNLGYQSGPLTTFTSFGFNSDDRGLTGINDRERLGALGVPTSFTNQDIFGESGNDGQNFTTTADYKVNKRDVLSNALIISHRTSSEDSRTGYSELNASRTVLDSYTRLRNDKASSTLFDYDATWKRTFERGKHELSSELRFNRSKDPDLATFWTERAGSTRVEGETDDTDALTQQLTGQVDYTKTFAPRTKLETGYKGTGRWLDRNYLVQKDSLGTGNWLKSNLSNDFSFDEMVQAAYGVLSQGYGKFDLQAGLRAEYANRSFSLTNPKKSYPYNYTSLFPSGIVLYKLDDATQIKASYSRRIRRPGTQELNPFPTFFDAQNVFVGNPNLNPEYTDAFEFGYSKTGKLGLFQVSPFYRHTTNVIRVIVNTAAVLDGRDVTTVSFQNLAKSNSWGTDVNGQLRLGPKFNGFAGFNLFKVVTDGGSTSALQSNALVWAYRLNLSSQVNKTLTLSANYNYRGPTNFERGRFSSFQQTNFAIRQKMYNDAVTVSLRFVDPFNTTGFKVRVGDDNITQITERKFGVRGTFLTFQYNFGQAPKIRIPQPDQQQAPGFPSG